MVLRSSAVLLACLAGAVCCAARTPLPPARPADLPSPPAADLSQAPLPPARPHDLVAYAPEPTTASTQAGEHATCAALLSRKDVVAQPIDPVVGEEGCGIDAPVSLSAVILPDQRRVDLVPHPKMRCDLATEVVRWIIDDLAPLLERDGRRMSRIANADSYDCRGRNRQANAKLSEHGKGDALDVVAVGFSDGRTIRFADKQNDLALAAAMRQSACARFATVLGPGSDGYHEDHVHLDLAARRNNGKLCEWDLQ